MQGSFIKIQVFKGKFELQLIFLQVEYNRFNNKIILQMMINNQSVIVNQILKLILTFFLFGVLRKNYQINLRILIKNK